jgi:hypothetical protein
LLLLANCTNHPASSWHEAIQKRNSGLVRAADLSGVSIPIVASTLEESWGKPAIEVSTEGAYRLTYANPAKPFDRLMIHGFPKPLPPAPANPPDISGQDMINGELTATHTPQVWKTSSVKGNPIRWYQESEGGGADGAYFATEGIMLKSIDFRTGYYRFVMEGDGNPFPSRLGTIYW